MIGSGLGSCDFSNGGDGGRFQWGRQAGCGGGQQVLSSLDCSHGVIAVLLGNDDGTLQPVVTFASGWPARSKWKWSDDVRSSLARR
jgi:hypothetical protein